jgi:chemotaxis protein MotB
MRDLTERTDDSLEAAYQKLQHALAALIGKGQVQVSLRELGVVIDINEVLLFHNGKADLTSASLPLVDEIAGILKDLPNQVQVNGFTDNVPIHNATFDSNWDLSATRAISVVKRFVAGGVNPAMIVGAGFGEFHPVAPNDSREHRAANRRVSIVVVSPLEDENGARIRLVGPEKRSVTSPALPGPAVPPLATPLPPEQTSLMPEPEISAPAISAPAPTAAPAATAKPAK